MPSWRIFCPVIRAAATAPRPAKTVTAPRSRRSPALSLQGHSGLAEPAEPLPC